MSRSALATIALATLLGGCRYQPTPVPLLGAPADISALAGTWTGEYESRDSGRSGTFTFAITAGKDTAFGDVVMVPRAGQPFTAADLTTHLRSGHSASLEVLRVTFVRVIGGMVEGTLEPYVAPDCQCVVSTVFQGVAKGNVISGDYVTHGAMGLRQQGTWSAQRQVIAAK
jgi:hypothetical protein